MRIALIDLNHMTLGVHTNTIPLGIGSIAYYLKNNAEHIDVRLYKNPAKFLDALKDWMPDVLGITQYSWNSELNLYAAQIVKKYNPQCLIVAGGPNLYLSREERLAYLKKQNFVDICVGYDGEMPFAEIVKRLINGKKIKDIRRFPVAGSYSIGTEEERLVESNEKSPRLESLDVFDSIYAAGFFDELLKEGFHPFLQTQRGCPFKCTYCHTGNDYCSRVIFQSAEYFKRDMEYLGKRFSGQHNITLYMANTNFGLFKEDIEIARVIREIQDKYDWPKNININSGNNLDRLSEILSILKYKFMPVNSLQTLTPKVLNNIKRKNIPLKDFVSFQKRVTHTIGENTATELILSLPEETKESFLNTVSLVLNSGVQNIVIFTLMALKGTLIASRETAKRYGHVIRHRIVPRAFSEIDGEKIFETEEAVIGTNSMSFDDYVNLRGLTLIITAFASSIEMFPIRKFLMDYELDIAKWIFSIHERISDFPGIYSVYNAFLQETKDELFPSREAIIEFFGKKENYDLLCAGKFGDNLIRKYKRVMLSRHYRDCLQIAFSELRRLVKEGHDLEIFNLFMNDLEVYLKSRDIGHIFNEGYNQTTPEVALHYDIPSWLASLEENVRLEDYKGSFFYSIVTTTYMHNRLKDFRQMNRNPELSLQILYRDGYIKDFWPEWVSKETE